MNQIAKLVRGRKSIRTFDGRELKEADKQKICSFVKGIENPYKIPVEFKLMSARENELSCPVVSGTDLYIGGKIKKCPQAEIAFGYSFEMLVLYAHSIGVGTVWLGGTMNRSAFEKAMELGTDEIMPCASPLGYPAQKMSLRESMMRKAIKADDRMNFESLFFDGSFDAPLTENNAGELVQPLEAVRLAPSAVNKQPWRAVVRDNAVHFYLKRSKGFGHGSGLDMQKIDMGIALCHFALAAKENDRETVFAVDDPHINTESDMEYIASYLIQK